MSTSSPDAHSTAQGNKVDITFIVRNGRHIFFDEEGGYTTDILREKGVSCRVFERLNLPNGFQLSDVATLGDRTRLLVVDCLIESSHDISEGGGLSTGLKFAEEVRKIHTDLPIWLLDPIDAGEHLEVGKRAKASQIEEIFLFDNGPHEFSEKVKAVLGKSK